jgi:hypothetical protein
LECDFISEGWLGNLDSNQDKQSQSLLCYRYTIPQVAEKSAPFQDFAVKPENSEAPAIRDADIAASAFAV